MCLQMMDTGKRIGADPGATWKKIAYQEISQDRVLKGFTFANTNSASIVPGAHCLPRTQT